MKRFISLILVLFAIFTAAAEVDTKYTEKTETVIFSNNINDYYIRSGITEKDKMPVVEFCQSKDFNTEVYRLIIEYTKSWAEATTSINKELKDMTFIKLVSSFEATAALGENKVPGYEDCKKEETKTDWCKSLTLYFMP